MVQHVLRTGNLGGTTYDNVLTGRTGTRTHQAFFKTVRRLFPNFHVLEEQTLRYTYETADFSLVINGRADLFLEKDPTAFLPPDYELPACFPPDTEKLIVEVKSVDSSLDQINPKGNPLHWAQCELYTFMHANAALEKEPEFTANHLLTYALAYVSTENLESTFLFRQTTYAELKERCFFRFAAYAAWGTALAEYRKISDDSMKAFRFPYPTLRTGQKELSNAVLQCIKSEGTLLAEAPTGIGKTVSTLYPALKAMGHGLCDRILYLTARTSVREVAARSLEDMRKMGLVLRSLTLTAKEKICFRPEICCESNLCEYAQGYYDRLPTALDELLCKQAIDRTAVETVAHKHTLCPHELSLDIARHCDVIIGDYNHAFDPRSRLTLFSEPQTRNVLLIDEAHNLPDRARTMYSAVLSKQEFTAAALALQKLKPELVDLIAPILIAFKKLDAELKADRPALNELEPSIAENKILRTTDFRSASSRAPALCAKLTEFVLKTQKLLDQIEDFSLKKPILNAYFSARFFLKVCDLYWLDDYIFILRRAGKDLLLEQTCMDVAAQLKRPAWSKNSQVFFSATLTPLSYYQTVLCGQERDEKSEQLSLPSPFNANQLNLLIYPLSTRFTERQQTAPRLADILAAVLANQAVNTLIYFPSYSYLKLVYPWLQQALGPAMQAVNRPLPTIAVQRQGMNENDQEQFLANFRQEKSLPIVGLAVLGGVFNEGIDLAGHALGGVICVGAGLPQLSPEREIMRNYFDTRGLNGYLFSYIYPGFNKIMQAAGRLIRSERDAGYVLLIDDRYLNHEYEEIFPDYWHPHVGHDLQELIELLEETREIEDL